MPADTSGYDVVIVGAGTTGCVLAARLSENPQRRVLLLEAGADHTRIEDFPVEVAQAQSMAASFPGHPQNWSFVGELRNGQSYPLPRGKIVGGSSAVNGTFYIRGRREDFDGWAALGNDLWSFEQVLPFFRKSETDLDIADHYHGTDGPIPVQRAAPSELRPVSSAFTEACLESGFAEEPDKNAPGPEGVGPIPRNSVDGYRMNTAVTYLAAARDRPNLTVYGQTLVRRVLFQGSRAIGVEAERAGRPVTFHGAQIVLAAGGIKTPQLLQLSGVGPADQLRRFGVPIVHDSPGVGQNAKDHPTVHVSFRVDEKATALPPAFSAFQTCLNYAAPGSAVGDLQIACTAASYAQMIKAVPVAGRRRPRLPSYVKRPLRTLGALKELPTGLVITQAANQDNLVLLCSLDAEESLGEVVLDSADPRAAPAIRLNYLDDPRDLPRLVHSVRTAIDLLARPSFARIGMRRVGPSDKDLADDRTLGDWITSRLATSFHTSCTARMGPASDPTSVVDQRGRVHGVDGLRIADISIMPTITRRGPAATAVMIGERIADLMDREPAA